MHRPSTPCPLQAQPPLRPVRRGAPSGQVPERDPSDGLEDAIEGDRFLFGREGLQGG